MTEEMMPLIETVPGAIRFHPDVFNDFYEKLEQQYQSVLPEKLKRLELLVGWLVDQASMESALGKVSRLVLKVSWRVIGCKHDRLRESSWRRDPWAWAAL